MRPRRIILLRHAQSEGNVDDTLFVTKADHQMELTPEGRDQARAAAKSLATQLHGESVHCYVSPYARTRQTLDCVREALGEQVVRVYEEPRLREQEWGNFQVREHVLAQKAARDSFGHFFYRFAHGESGADVFDRVSTFLETLHRDFSRENYPPNALLVTHGLTMRLFLMRWFHWSVEYFESLENPCLCEQITLALDPVSQSYALTTPLRQWKPVPLVTR
ncbi:MAG: histidine phosphatase family protein [Deltaproteobacteria bacterium]|nr:histidine phosphatase family protein [Deltaproteobacteria bacterium]